MTRTLSLAASLAAGAALVVPTQALAVRAPPPLEWETAAPAPAARAASAGPVVSRPVRARGTFNVVGLRWRGAGPSSIVLRVREPGRRWGRWTSVPAEADGGPDPRGPERAARGVSAPVWTGEARWLQYRLSRPVAGLRLHFVDSMRTVRRLPAPRARASQLAGAPAVVPRAAWGGDSCAPRGGPAYGRVQAAMVHHTVTATTYTPQQAAAAVLGICRYHRNSNGWNDVGYNFLVDRYGTIYEGRAGGIGNPVVGAQAQGMNAETTGIANLGTFTGAAYQTPEALDAMARLIRWKLPLHGAPTAGAVSVLSTGGSTSRFPRGTNVTIQRISGHRDTNATSCPGDDLFSQLGDLRARVGSVLPVTPLPLPPVSSPGRPSRTKIEAAVSPGVVRFGEQPLVQGRLRLLKGDPVGDAPLQVQGLAGKVWRTLVTTRSRGDGSFGVGVPASVRRVLRVRFAGDPGRRSSTSRQAVVLVRPTIRARASVRRAPVGRTPVISGRIDPAKSGLVLVAERRVGRRWVRVRRDVLRVRRGSFRKAVRLARPGLHRVIVVFGGDGANLGVGASPVFVRATSGRVRGDAGGGAGAP